MRMNATTYLFLKYDSINVLDTHGDYPEAMKELAREQSVPVIDLHKRSLKLLDTLGPIRSKALYMWIDPHPNFPDGAMDEYNISSFVYRRVRPFHPGRFMEWLEGWPEEVVRAKGFYWLASRNDTAGKVGTLKTFGQDLTGLFLFIGLVLLAIFSFYWRWDDFKIGRASCRERV